MEINWNGCENPITKAEKDLWLQALRSGKYKQDTRCLSSGRGYCCLGVLNEVLALGVPGDISYLSSSEGKDASFQKLPRWVQTTLGYKNDHQSWNFNKIADFIEAEINPKH